MIKLVLTFCLFSPLFQIKVSPRPPDYILLQYNGPPVDAGIHTIVFSIKSFDRSEAYFPIVFNIKKCEYSVLSKVIKESGIAKKIDTLDVGYYNFFIVHNYTKELYATMTLLATKKIFTLITEKASHFKEGKIIDDILKEMLESI